MAGKSDAEMQINFFALKKHDENIEHIIDTASSVAHYRFNSTSGVWEKTDVEGTLFLYARKTSPYVIIFIMNRLSKDNAKLILTADMEFKVQEPFLLCNASNNEIIGIWFYDGAECRHFGALLSRFSSLSIDEKSLQIAIMMDAQKRGKNCDSDNRIMKMFTQAQHEYSESRSKFMQRQQTHNKINQKPKDKIKHNETRGYETSAPNLKLSPESALPTGKMKTYSEQPNLCHDVTSKDGELNKQRERFKNIHKKEKEILFNDELNLYQDGTSKKDELDKQRERFENEHKKEQELLFNILHSNNKGRTRSVSSGHEFDASVDSSRSSILSSDAGDLALFNELGIIREQHIADNTVKEKAIGCAELELQLVKGNKIKTELDQSVSSPKRIENLQSVRRNNISGIFDQTYTSQRNGNLDRCPNSNSSELSKLVGAKTSTTLCNSESIPAACSIRENGSNVSSGISIVAPHSSSDISSSKNEPAPYSSTKPFITTSVDLTSHLLSPYLLTTGKGRGTTISTINGQNGVALAANFRPGNKSSKKNMVENPKGETTSKSKFPEAPSGAAMNSLMAPAAFQTSSSSANKVDVNSDISVFYSKEQFQNILLEIIQTDSEFVSKLHEAFLEKIRRR